MATMLLSKIVSSDLALREAANDFFDAVDARSDYRITVDFTGIRSISRSFAHQYLLRKDDSSKEIIETNVPSNVRKMFEVVKAGSSRTGLISVGPVSALHV